MFICPNCFYIPKFKMQIILTSNDFIIQSKCSCGNIPLRLDNFFNNSLIDLTNPKCNLNKKVHINSNDKGKNLCFLCKKILCEQCSLIHKKATKHVILKISDILNKCLKHSKELIGYCCDCRVNFCEQCNYHINHKKKLNPNKIIYDNKIKEYLQNIEKEIQKIDDNNNINVKIFCFIKLLYKAYISDYAKFYYQIRKNFFSNSNVTLSNHEIIINTIKKIKYSNILKEDILIKVDSFTINKKANCILCINNSKICAGFMNGQIKVIFIKRKKLKTINVSNNPIIDMIKFNNEDKILINSNRITVIILNLKNYSFNNILSFDIKNIFIQIKNNDLILGSQYKICIYNNKQENFNLNKEFIFENNKNDDTSVRLNSKILEINNICVIFINNSFVELNINDYCLKKTKDIKFSKDITLHKVNNEKFIVSLTNFIHIISLKNYQIITTLFYINEMVSVLVKNSFIIISFLNENTLIIDKNFYYTLNNKKYKLKNIINFFDNQIISDNEYSSNYIIYSINE